MVTLEKYKAIKSTKEWNSKKQNLFLHFTNEKSRHREGEKSMAPISDM